VSSDLETIVKETGTIESYTSVYARLMLPNKVSGGIKFYCLPISQLG